MIPSRISGLQKIFIHKNPGTYRLRILPVEPISGIQYWNHEDKVVRVRSLAQVVNNDINRSKPGDGPKQFYGYIIYSYDEESIQVWTFTQFNILRKLEQFEADPAAGDLTNYDIEIVKTIEEGIEEYNVTQMEPSDISSDILARLSLLKIDLEMLFSTESNPHPVSSEVFVDVLTEPEARITDINDVVTDQIRKPVSELVSKIKLFTTLEEYKAWDANYDFELKKLGVINRAERALIEDTCLEKQGEFNNYLPL